MLIYAQKIHNDIVCQDLLRIDILLGFTLANMYAKSGVFQKAHHVLEESLIQNVVYLRALIR